mmetsp:Transcript_22735/g.75391  ORF Transcript_22735/g.75391 Transcript_22735/m.75391 type:complete len:226 (-) Transcript_22735:275-952(-)
METSCEKGRVHAMASTVESSAVATLGTPLPACTFATDAGSTRSLAAETATRAEVQSKVLSSPKQESAPPIVTHAASQSPTCSDATRTKEPSDHARTCRLKTHHSFLTVAPRLASRPTTTTRVLCVQRRCDGERDQIGDRHEHDRDAERAREVAARLLHLGGQSPHRVVSRRVPQQHGQKGAPAHRRLRLPDKVRRPDGRLEAAPAHHAGDGEGDEGRDDEDGEEV